MGFLTVSVITCYDFSDHTGCSYLFSNDDDAKAFAKALGIQQMEYLNAEGAVESVSPLEGTAPEQSGQADGTPFIDPDECLFCGACVDICPVDAIQAGDKSYKIDASQCIACGICEIGCPVNAIRR